MPKGVEAAIILGGISVEGLLTFLAQRACDRLLRHIQMEMPQRWDELGRPIGMFEIIQQLMARHDQTVSLFRLWADAAPMRCLMRFLLRVWFSTPIWLKGDTTALALLRQMRWLDGVGYLLLIVTVIVASVCF